MTDYLIRLPWPNSALSSNASVHWSVKAEATKKARRDAWALALEKGLRNPMPDAEIVFTYHQPTNHARDVHNMPWMLKAYIDGIADAMGCDDNRFRVKYPDVFGENTKGGAILAHVKPLTVILPITGEIS